MLTSKSKGAEDFYFVYICLTGLEVEVLNKKEDTFGKSFIFNKL
jgi:hypothetical protein